MYRIFLSLLAALLTTPTIAETFPPESLTAGVAGDETACRARSDSVWVAVDGKGECIRYYSAGFRAGQNKAAVIYVHGDRLLGDKPTSYDDNESTVQRQRVEEIATEIGLPFVRIARPGTYGSSGNHANRRQIREVRLVDAAVAAIRERYQIENVGLTGQSGGGTNAAYVLSRQRDLACVALTSAALSMKSILASDPQSIYDTRSPGLYNPIDHVGEIPANPRRLVYVIGAEVDRISPLVNQREYADALRSRGNSVYLIEGHATGSAGHSLDRTGRHVATWCLQGVPTEEIVRRVRTGQIKG